MRSKKALSSVIAIALLIITTIVSIVSFQNWYYNYVSSTFSNVENKDDYNNIIIDKIVGDTLYVVNNEDSAINVISLEIDGISCSLSSLNVGMNVVDIDRCLGYVTTNKPDVILQTQNDLYEKKFFFDSSVEIGDLLPIYTDTFISVWNTSKTSAGSSNSNQVALPLYNGGAYNFVVDWGDGSNSTITAWDDANVTHTYASEGEYEIRITGQIDGFRFNNGGDKLKLVEIKAWGPLKVGNNGFYFYGCSNLVYTGNDDLNLSGITSLNNMFRDATSFTGDLSSWDVSNILIMTSMFFNANNFAGDLSNWDVSSVTDMNSMFYGSSNFNSDLSSWDVSNVLNMGNMFRSASSFTGDLSSWDVSSVKNMDYMFQDVVNFAGDLSNWDVGSVSSMIYMFYGSSNFNSDLSSWDVSQVIYMGSLFRNAINFNSDLSNWNVSSVTNMDQMFRGASNFNRNLSNWDVDQVTSCTDFNLTTPVWNLPKPIFTSC